MKKLAPVAGLVAILCLVGSNAFAQTEVSGYQSGTWSFGGRPYIVTGSVTVPAGSTLTIEPGVVVKFCQYRGLSVHGTLIADGTSAHTILFTSNKDSVAPGDWSSIYFYEGSSSSILDHCIVEYGGGGTTIFANVYI